VVDLQISPKNLGTFTLGPASVLLDGKQELSNTLTIHIGEASQSSTGANVSSGTLTPPNQTPDTDLKFRDELRKPNFPQTPWVLISTFLF